MPKNSEYWEKRIASENWKVYNSLEEKNRELLQFYTDASESIKDELYRIAEKYSKDGVLSLSDMHKQNRLAKLNKKFESIIEELGHTVEDVSKKNMQNGFRDVYKNTAVSIGDTDFSMPNKKLMEKMLNTPWRGDTFSKRLWKNEKNLAVSLNDVLLTGLQQGKTITEIAIMLHNRMGQGFNECHRLVRTETMHYLNDATLQRYKDADIKYVQIWAALDERTCETCGSYHEKIYPIDKCPHVPLHANCRCTILPVVDEKEEHIHRNMRGKEVQSTTRSKKQRRKSGQIVKKTENRISEDERIKNEFLSRKYEQLSLEEFKKMHHTVSREERKILYGKSHFSGYINSGNARKLNKLLREGSDLPKDYQEISNTLSEVIKKNSVQKDIVVTRYVSRDALESIAGIAFPKSPGLLSGKEGVERYWTDIENLKENIKVGHSYIEKGFLSTSGVSDKNVMNDKEIQLVIKVPKGTNAYITTNDRESEIIFGVGTKLEIINVNVENNRTTDLKIVLDCLMR